MGNTSAGQSRCCVRPMTVSASHGSTLTLLESTRPSTCVAPVAWRPARDLPSTSARVSWRWRGQLQKAAEGIGQAHLLRGAAIRHEENRTGDDRRDPAGPAPPTRCTAALFWPRSHFGDSPAGRSAPCGRAGSTRCWRSTPRARRVHSRAHRLDRRPRGLAGMRTP